MSIKSDIEDIFKDVVFVVEADDFAQHMLWKTHHDADVKWEDEGRGHLLRVGSLVTMPVCISIMYAKIEGRRVAFWYPSGQVVDHRIIDNWLGERCGHLKWDGGHRPARCNATNFHHCLDAIRELNK